MKKLFLIALFFIAFNALSQEKFAIVIAQQKPFSQKYVFTADFGQATTAFSDQRIKDAEGELVKFNSTADMLNYMTAQGWTFVNNTDYVNQNVIFQRFIFKRPN